MIYLQLFLTFLEIGAVSFGGGYGMISLICERVLTYGWLQEDELLNVIAASAFGYKLWKKRAPSQILLIVLSGILGVVLYGICI